MKKLTIAAALAAMTVVTPAFAGDFTGPRVEATVGVNNVNHRT